MDIKYGPWAAREKTHMQVFYLTAIKSGMINQE